MGFFKDLIRKVKTMIRGYQGIEDAFGVQCIKSDKMDDSLLLWDNISTGKPPWKNAADDIKTINMADFIANTRAKLTALDIGIAISGSARADYLQGLADELLKLLPDKLADADRMGGILFKFNGRSWDFLLPDEFGITHADDNGSITGAVFAIQSKDTKFTRLEWHRFDNGTYIVTNRAFRNRVRQIDRQVVLGDPVPLSSVEDWKDMRDEVHIANLEAPLWGFYRVPGSNIIDQSSPLGMPVYGRAIEELKAVDIAISRKDTEIEDSKHVTFVGQIVLKNVEQGGGKLPRWVQGLGIGIDDGKSTGIHEHSATLLTESRIKDINFNLSLLGVKCGFSEGVFVLDGQSGMITATQVEADDRDTVQTIKADRDALQAAIDQALKGADALASLLNLAPMGSYEVAYSFGDITYNYEEDKANWKSYVQQGWVPAWLYFVKFEKMSEEEAKRFTQEAEKAKAKGLFEEE